VQVLHILRKIIHTFPLTTKLLAKLHQKLGIGTINNKLFIVSSATRFAS